jgi:uncharacterized membrane protein
MRSDTTASVSSMGAPDTTDAVVKPGTEIERRGGRPPAPDEVIEGDPVPLGRRLAVQSASFSGPLPAPGILASYDDVVPGLAREIVDQWKAETRHRHATVAAMREIDRDELTSYYEAERRGQVLSFLAIVGVLVIAAVAIVLDRPAVGVTSLLTGAAAAVWAMRRRSDGTYADADAPVQLDDGGRLARGSLGGCWSSGCSHQYATIMLHS